MTLNWPWVFLLLPLPMWFWFHRQWLRQSTSIPVSPRMAAAFEATQQSTSIRTNRQQLLAWLMWCLLLLALAQPNTPNQATVQPASGRALSVVIDLSGSMDRTDFDWNGEQSDRLSVVKALANEFIEARSAGRATGIGDALGLAIQTLRDDPSPEKAIVLLSDGTNNAGAVEPESAAALAAERGVRVHTIALGSDREREDAYSMPPSADLDEDTLKSIAASAGGEFFRAKTSNDLRKIYTTIDQLETAESDTPPIVVRRDLRHWPLIALFFLLCLRAFMNRRST